MALATEVEKSCLNIQTQASEFHRYILNHMNNSPLNSHPRKSNWPKLDGDSKISCKEKQARTNDDMELLGRIKANLNSLHVARNFIFLDTISELGSNS